MEPLSSRLTLQQSDELEAPSGSWFLRVLLLALIFWWGLYRPWGPGTGARGLVAGLAVISTPPPSRHAHPSLEKL